MVPHFLMKKSKLDRLFWGVLLLVLLFVPESSVYAQVSKKPARFALVVDVSGSMIGYYQRRDPRPPLAVELVESLIIETMIPGDQLVVLSFGSSINDAPGQIIALASFHPKVALSQIENLGLCVQPGKGTLRTAAIGRAINALDALPKSAGVVNSGIIYVVTDSDADRVPNPNDSARKFYDLARKYKNNKQLECISRVYQGGIILEIWQWKGSPNAPLPPSSAQTIAKVKEIIHNIIPDRPITSGPIAIDFERGGLSITPIAKEWIRTKDGFELPVTIKSNYTNLHFKGKSKKQFVSAIGKSNKKACFTLVPDEMVLAPGKSINGKLKLRDTVKLGILNISSIQYKIKSPPAIEGYATTDPALFTAPDPQTTAKVTGAIWVSNCVPKVNLEMKQLPNLPPVSPPRMLQIISLAAIIAAALIAKRKLCPPVMPLTVNYWVEGDATHRVVVLRGKDSTEFISGASVTIKRDGASSSIIVKTTTDNVSLLSADGQKEYPELRFSSGSRFIVKNPDGRLTSMNFDFGDKIPVRPLPADQDTAFPSDSEDNTSNSKQDAGDNDWRDIIS